MCTSCFVGGEWTSQARGVVGAEGGKECLHLPWLLLLQDLLTVPEYSFCVNSFWLLSELGWAQGLSYSPSSGSHFSSPQSHDIVFGPYFLLSLLLVLGIWMSLVQLPLGGKHHQCKFWKGSLSASSSAAIDLSCSAFLLFLSPLFSRVGTLWPLLCVVPSLENIVPSLSASVSELSLRPLISSALLSLVHSHLASSWYPGNRGAFSGIRRTNCKSEELLWAPGLGYRILILCWQRV